jgi:hypothetical protein
MVGLAQFFHIPVKLDEECAAGFTVIGVLDIVRKVAFIKAPVVMVKNPRDVNAIGAGHAVLAACAHNVLELGDELCRAV